MDTVCLRKSTFAKRILLLIVVCLAVAFWLSPVSADDNRYVQRNLVSDIPGINERTVDANLVNSWGIAHNPTGPWWVADNGTGVSTVYDGEGLPFPIGSPLVVTIPASPTPGSTNPSPPTGIVFNPTNDFQVTSGNPATFIWVTEDGTIAAWNRTISGTMAVLKVDNFVPDTGPVYKGATLGRFNNQNLLYVANFRGGTVDVFDGTFKPFTLPAGAFADAAIPAGFAPFNVQNINGFIYVTYAKQDAAKHDDVAGPGNGFVDVFTSAGKLVSHLQTGPWMNSPWGVVLAPNDFGKFGNHILVGMFGSGNIAAFDVKNGSFDALLKNQFGDPFTIKGLWGLGFGNGGTAGPTNVLFFAAGIDDEAHGLFGRIRAIEFFDRDCWD